MLWKVIILCVFISDIASGVILSDITPDWNTAVLNTAESAEYLSQLEKEIILEVNKLRSNPSKYAKDYLVPLTGRYKQKLFYYPEDKPLRTQEGVKALQECINDLKNQHSLSLLFPDPGLSKAAGDHVRDQSKTGRTGHTGSDRSNFRDRIERYGKWEGRIAENIAYGGATARQVVIYLLIDDGVSSRGHRKNFLNADFRVVGVAAGDHPSFGNMTVINFAGGFKTQIQ